MIKDIELDHLDWTYINDLMIEEKRRLCIASPVQIDDEPDSGRSAAIIASAHAER